MYRIFHITVLFVLWLVLQVSGMLRWTQSMTSLKESELAVR